MARPCDCICGHKPTVSKYRKTGFSFVYCENPMCDVVGAPMCDVVGAEGEDGQNNAILKWNKMIRELRKAGIDNEHMPMLRSTDCFGRVRR